MAQTIEQELIPVLNKAQSEFQKWRKAIKLAYDTDELLKKGDPIFTHYCDDRHDKSLIDTIITKKYNKNTLWVFAHTGQMKPPYQLKKGAYVNAYHQLITDNESVQSFVFIVCVGHEKFHNKNTIEAAKAIKIELEKTKRSVVIFDGAVFTVNDGVFVCGSNNIWQGTMPEKTDEYKDFESYEKKIQCLAKIQVSQCRIVPVEYLHHLSKQPGYHEIDPSSADIRHKVCKPKYKKDAPPQVDAKECWKAIKKDLEIKDDEESDSVIYFDGEGSFDNKLAHKHLGYHAKKHHDDQNHYDYHGRNDVLIDIEYGILLVNIIGILCLCCFIAICIGLLGGIGISGMIRSIKKSKRKIKYSSIPMDGDSNV